MLEGIQYSFVFLICIYCITILEKIIMETLSSMHKNGLDSLYSTRGYTSIEQIYKKDK